jgi:hypothetical protein
MLSEMEKRTRWLILVYQLPSAHSGDLLGNR